MKNHLLAPLAVAAILLSSSCRKVEKILPDQLGQWDITTYEESVFHRTTLISTREIDDPIYLTFYDDGYLAWEEGGYRYDFNWEASEKYDLVTLCEEYDGGDESCFTYDIDRSNGSTQRWEGFDQYGDTTVRIKMVLDRPD